MIVVLDTNIVASLKEASGTRIISASDFLRLLGVPENPT